jgi:hypothetical protein
MYKGPTDRKTTTINGQLIDYTDPANVQVLFGDKTRKYQTVNGQIVDITDPANTSIVFDGSTPDLIRIIGRRKTLAILQIHRRYSPPLRKLRRSLFKTICWM